eukprot:3438333-Amphidinium_carterae.1
MKLEAINVLLAYVCLLTMMLGPTLPLLFPLALALILVHRALFFCGFVLLNTIDEPDYRLPRLGLRFAFYLVVMVQGLILGS